METNREQIRKSIMEWLHSKEEEQSPSAIVEKVLDLVEGKKPSEKKPSRKELIENATQSLFKNKNLLRGA